MLPACAVFRGVTHAHAQRFVLDGAGGAGICVVVFIFLPKFLAIIISLPVAIFAAALAFYRVNDKPFINMVEAFLKYAVTKKLYIWKRTPPTPKSSDVPKEKPLEQVYVPKLSDSKLKELTWSLDIQENQNPVTQEENSKS